MSTFKTKLNPIIPIGRSLFSLVLLLFLVLSFGFMADTYQKEGFESAIGSSLLILFFGMLFYMFFSALFRNTKSYIIQDECIIVNDYFGFKSGKIDKSDVMGFSTSHVPYNFGREPQIIIYIKDGTKFQLTRFEYFNFKEIKPALRKRHYRYFGYEPYVWKWFNSRSFQFD